jgi:hypothetical protein
MKNKKVLIGSIVGITVLGLGLGLGLKSCSSMIPLTSLKKGVNLKGKYLVLDDKANFPRNVTQEETSVSYY